MKKYRNSNTKKSPLAVFIFGILFSVATLTTLSFISSFILMSTKNPLLSIKMASLVTLLAAGAISGFVIAKYKGNLSFGISIAASATVAILMLAISLISAKGNVSGGIFMNYLCYVLVSAFFSFVGRKRSVRRHRRT